MPPFHDTRLWYHALIGQKSSCWQIRGALDSITLFQYHAPTIREKIVKTQTSSKQYKFVCKTFGLSLNSKKSKKYACDLLQKEKQAFKSIELYLYSPVINCSHIYKAMDL